MTKPKLDIERVKFTVLAQKEGKILVGNRLGKVFAASARWLNRCPHIWRKPVLVDSRVIEVPRIEPLSVFVFPPPPIAEPVEFKTDRYELKQWAYIAKSGKYDWPPLKIFCWCVYNPHKRLWYVWRQHK